MPYQRVRTPIGTRRERITLQYLPTEDDGMGGQRPATKWKDQVKTWAAVTPLDERTREALQAQQITALHAYHMDIRYRTGVTPAMRVIWRGQTFQIHTVADDEARKRRLILLCAETQRAA